MNNTTLRASLSGTFLKTLSARAGDTATEGALLISVQLSTDDVSTVRKVRVLIRLKATASKHARKHEARPPW